MFCHLDIRIETNIHTVDSKRLSAKICFDNRKSPQA